MAITKPGTPEALEEDQRLAEELIEMIQRARDRAHWMAVHRRWKLAKSIEMILDALLVLAREQKSVIYRKRHEVRS